MRVMSAAINRPTPAPRRLRWIRRARRSRPGYAGCRPWLLKGHNGDGSACKSFTASADCSSVNNANSDRPAPTLTGDEAFTSRGQAIGTPLGAFWSWACLDLLSNTMRGVLAEYIVGLALDCVDGRTRLEWDAADLRTADGARVEVKSSAYLQSWQQQQPSRISFDIRPTTGWDAPTNTYATERKRQADVYVFCVFTPTDKDDADPLNLDQWDFYVMSTNRLNAAVGEQKTITLTSLRRHEPLKCAFAKLRECIHTETQLNHTTNGR